MKARELVLLSEYYLVEGGAVGHLMHLYDNRELTFGELKDVISSAAEGRLDAVSEKLDGMNLVFTFNPDEGLKVARGQGDIKSGGRDADSLAQKFQGRGNVADAFNDAFKVLGDAVGALPDAAKDQIFDGGNTWYSMEVIYSKNPNVINYDKDCIVFHHSPVFHRQDDGTIEGTAAGPGVGILQKHIDRMQNALKMKSWQVRGPVMTRLKTMSDGAFAEAAINAIEAAQNAGGVDDNGTIGDYLHNVIGQEVADLGLEPAVAKAVTARIVGMPGAPGLPQIKKMVAPEVYSSVRTFVEKQRTLMQHAIMPIEHAVHAFAIELLRGMHSALVDNGDAEVARLRQQVSGAVKALEGSSDAKAMDTLNAQLSKLGNTDNITAAMEGIVFIYKGKAYKFTGSFAPVNQILGMFRYPRGTTQENMQLREMIDHMISRHT